MTKSQEFNAFESTIMKNVVVMSMTFTLLVESELYLLALLIFQRYYVVLSKTKIRAKTKETIPLAFTIADNLDPETVDGFTLSWTKEALANFAQLHNEVKKIKNLPYASLRGLLEFRLSNISRIEPSMGLNSYTVSRQKQQSFAYICSEDNSKAHENKEEDKKQHIENALKTILNDWIETYFVPYCNREGVSKKAIQQLRKLREDNQLLLVKPFTSQIFPWGWDDSSGTTQSKDRHSFPQFADYIARKHGDRIFNFKLNRRKNKDTDKWEWQPDSSFSVLQSERELDLPLDKKFNGVQIANGEASTDDCQVLLTYSDSDGNQSHDIKAGVPEKDKLEAFWAIKEIFEPLKITPFNAYIPVEISHPTQDKKDTDAATKQINKPTLLNAVMELLDNPQTSKFTSKYLDRKTDSEINQLLNKHFKFTLSEKGLKLFRFNTRNKDQSAELNHLIKLNKEAIKRLYPDTLIYQTLFIPLNHLSKSCYGRILIV